MPFKCLVSGREVPGVTPLVTRLYRPPVRLRTSDRHSLVIFARATTGPGRGESLYPADGRLTPKFIVDDYEVWVIAKEAGK